MNTRANEPIAAAVPQVMPCTKRVRVFLGGELVVDTIRAKLVWEVPHYPQYYLPIDDGLRERLRPMARRDPSFPLGNAAFFDVHGGNGRVARAAAWHYPDSPVEAIRGHARLDWDAMDGWFEEDDEVFVHPHDPTKRIDILHSSRHIEVSFRGVKLADTRRPTLVYETGAPVRHYLPKVDVRMGLLTPTEKRTGCAYKGFARYWRVEAGDGPPAEIAWSYPTPLAEAAKIAGLIAFYDEQVDTVIDGVLQPRPARES